MNQLNLVVPGLCGPLPDLEGLQASSSTASLARLLARADKTRNTSKGFHPELASLFGMNESAAMPSAALSLLGYGQPQNEGNWLHADPVHLQADMDHAILRDSRSLDISPAESEALIEEINTHFKNDSIYLHAVDQDHWFLNVGEHDDVATTPLHDVIGHNVNFFLPRGKDEKFIKSFMNEVQMLIHMSKVNQAREQSGLLPVNSLWLWGEGKLPAAGKTDIRHVYSNHSLVKGLAEVHAVKHYPLNDPESLFEAIDQKNSFLVVNDELFNIACYGDVLAWQQSLETLFDSWIEPVVSRAMKNKIPVNLYPCNGMRYVITSTNRYRILRRGDIKEHISIHE